MTQNAIVEKLHRELSGSCDLTEGRVVYILAEIRKLMELTDQRNNYYALYFYCCWALHSTMSWGAGVERILRRFDEAYPLLIKNHLHELPNDLQKEIKSTIGLERLQVEMKAFLSRHKLPTALADEDWTKFMRQYASIIEDCPLTLEDEALNLKHIKKVTVHKEDAEKRIGLDKEYQRFRIRWVSHGKEDKTGIIEIYHTVP